MTKISDVLENWRIENVRGSQQINKEVMVSWFNKWFHDFQKMLLEYVSWKNNTAHRFRHIEKDKDEYELPLTDSDTSTSVQDFYSIIQLRVAYDVDKLGQPIYRVCRPLEFWDYNLKPLKNKWVQRMQYYKRHVLIDPEWDPNDKENWAKDENGKYIYDEGREPVYDKNWNPIYDLKARGWTQHWEPFIWGRVSEQFPRYTFIDKNHIKIFPTPTKDVDNGITIAYNFMQKPISYDDIYDNDIEESDLCLPRYFMDAIEDFMTYKLYQVENPEQAQWYYQLFQNTINDNIYGMNKDKRPVEEWFANTTYFSHF